MKEKDEGVISDFVSFMQSQNDESKNQEDYQIVKQAISSVSYKSKELIEKMEETVKSAHISNKIGLFNVLIPSMIVSYLGIWLGVFLESVNIAMVFCVFSILSVTTTWCYFPFAFSLKEKQDLKNKISKEKIDELAKELDAELRKNGTSLENCVYLINDIIAKKEINEIPIKESGNNEVVCKQNKIVSLVNEKLHKVEQEKEKNSKANQFKEVNEEKEV